MNKRVLRITFFFVFIAGLALISQGVQTDEATASPPLQEDEDALLERGEYLANVGACIFCHTPFQEEYDETAGDLDEEAIRTLALFEANALDLDLQFSGNHRFSLGPLGYVLSTNITPDEETGIGTWTDEEIETALRTGVRPDESIIFPLMPRYTQMSNDDMAAIIAFLRSMDPIENEVLDISETVASQPYLDSIPATPLMEPLETPSDDEPVELGAYLVNQVLACSHCHTPVNQTTGEPLFDQYLAGGQPFEGPYGLIFAANLTPHDETGLGEWTEEDIKRALVQGLSNDGRRLFVMPWQFYARLSEEDLDSVVAFLQNAVEPVENEVPPVAVDEVFIEIIDIGDSDDE